MSRIGGIGYSLLRCNVLGCWLGRRMWRGPRRHRTGDDIEVEGRTRHGLVSRVGPLADPSWAYCVWSKCTETRKPPWDGGFGVLLRMHDPRPPGYTDGTKIARREASLPWFLCNLAWPVRQADVDELATANVAETAGSGTAGYGNRNTTRMILTASKQCSLLNGPAACTIPPDENESQLRDLGKLWGKQHRSPAAVNVPS